MEEVKEELQMLEDEISNFCKKIAKKIDDGFPGEAFSRFLISTHDAPYELGYREYQCSFTINFNSEHLRFIQNEHAFVLHIETSTKSRNSILYKIKEVQSRRFLLSKFNQIVAGFHFNLKNAVKKEIKRTKEE